MINLKSTKYTHRRLMIVGYVFVLISYLQLLCFLALPAGKQLKYLLEMYFLKKKGYSSPFASRIGKVEGT